MEVIVSVVGYYPSPDKMFVPKEIAILEVSQDSVPIILHLKPPYRLTETERTIVKFFEKAHGIPWNSGSIPFKDMFLLIRNSILADAKIIYVHGTITYNWLMLFLPLK